MSPGTTHRLGRMSALSAAVGVCLAASPVVARPPDYRPVGSPASALATRIGLVSQNPLDLSADGTVTLVLDLPTLSPPLDIATYAEALVVVTAYRPVVTRLEVAEAQQGTLTRGGDTVELPLAAVPSVAAGQLTVTVPTETTARTAEALQLPEAGLYPLLIEVINGEEVLAELTTFVHRLPTEDEPTLAPLPVAIAMTTTSPVVLDGDPLEVQLDDDTVAELSQLADLLEASDYPVAVRVPPALLLAVADLGSEGEALAQRLAAGLARNEMLSSPRLPLDPSVAASADVDPLYTQWLRDGEDDLAQAMANPSRRTLVFADEPLSEDGAALLRDLGARLMVTTPEIFDALPLSTGIYTDLSQLVQLQVAPGVTADATVTERVLGPVLARATSTPALTGITAAAHLLAYRQEIVDAGDDPRRHGVTLGTPDLSLPNTATYAAVTEVLMSTDGIEPTTLDVLGVRTDHAILNSNEVVVGLPTSVPGSLTERLDLVTSLSLQALSASSMLPSTDPRGTQWSRVIEVLPTSALSDDQVQALAVDLRGQYAEVRDAIEVPEGFKFTLTGRSTTVPIKLRNTSDGPLTVRVRMSSSKLLFPDGDQMVELPPQSFTEVRIQIEARTNGRFPVTLQVFTPIGDSELAPAVPLIANVNALSGLGNLITGALLLVVLTWWVRHVRQKRRSRAAATAASRHPGRRVPRTDTTPADDPRADDPAHDQADDSADDSAHVSIDDTELSPDAATSTLPPL